MKKGTLLYTFTFILLAFTCNAVPIPLPAKGEDSKFREESRSLVQGAADIQTKVLDHAIGFQQKGLPVMHEREVNIQKVYDNRAYRSDLKEMRALRPVIKERLRQTRYRFLESQSEKDLNIHHSLYSAEAMLKTPPHENDGLAQLEAIANGRASHSPKNTSDLEKKKENVEKVRNLVSKGKGLSNWFRGQSSKS